MTKLHITNAQLVEPVAMTQQNTQQEKFKAMELEGEEILVGGQFQPQQMLPVKILPTQVMFVLNKAKGMLILLLVSQADIGMQLVMENLSVRLIQKLQ